MTRRFNSINLSSNGNAQFTTTDTPLATLVRCRGPTHDYTIFPYWDDQLSVNRLRGLSRRHCGIFTSVTGNAPNRIFNIEWRTVYFTKRRARQSRAEVV